MEGLVILALFVVICVGIQAAWEKAKKHQEEKETNRMKRRNPNAWLRQQEIENERQQREHDIKVMEHEEKMQKRKDFEKGLEIGEKLRKWWFGW